MEALRPVIQIAEQERDAAQTTIDQAITARTTAEVQAAQAMLDISTA